MLDSLRPDDCVWDIGANIGFYTEQFAGRVTYVVAFEPIPGNAAQIRGKNLPNVDCRQLALGETITRLRMTNEGHLSSLALTSYAAEQTETVTVVPGDSLTELPRPTVVKIDVEGYEPEVIRGMTETLRSVRAVFLELHFAILERRGMRQAPASIIKTLKKLGFETVTWPDASHVGCFR